MIHIFGKLKQFWNNFWQSLKVANAKANEPLDLLVQSWQDVGRINLLDIFVNKLNNLTNTEATFDIDSDSTVTEPLKVLCKDIEDKRFILTEAMLGEGDAFVLPMTDSHGKIVHAYLPQSKVRIVTVDGENITEAYCILAEKDDGKHVYRLLRNHKLDPDGTLYITYKTVNDRGEPVTVDEWEQWKQEDSKWEGANHIGFGRYKSPASSRGHSPKYGVPLNFGCAELEAKIATDFKRMDDEFRNGKSVIFTDPKNLKNAENKCVWRRDSECGYEIADNIIPIQQRSGQTNNIDIFAPPLRFNEQYGKLMADLGLYEKQIGTSKGFLTDNQTTETATATAVKRANSDTISLLEKIRTAIDTGNEMALEADCVFLGIRNDIWTYSSDWYDPFEDPSEQWSRLVEAKQIGAAEQDELIRFRLPDLTHEEIDEKIARIKEESDADANAALDRILNGR